jgi:hypothetical protein
MVERRHICISKKWGELGEEMYSYYEYEIKV